MKKTLELYYEDAYMSTFDAKVLDISSDNDILKVVLDKTAFFPTAGGQTCDRGTINGVPVVDVSIENGIITHTLTIDAKANINCNETVTGEIDFSHRFSNMQQHTGEHIFSGIVKKLFGYENVGFHLSDNTVTMDYDGPLSLKDIEKIERLSNIAIYENHPIKAFFPKEDELDDLEFRSKLELSEMDKVRLVEIENVDLCACCAPHVNQTSEVGLIKVVDFINYKGGMRLTILCGNRAIDDYTYKHNTLKDLSHIFSCPIEEIKARVDALQSELESKQNQIKELEEISLHNASKNAHETDSFKLVFCNVNDKFLIRNFANDYLSNGEKTILLFNGTDEIGYSFIIASNSEDVSDILKDLSENIQIKGGGKPPMIQGHTDATSQIIKDTLDQRYN